MDDFLLRLYLEHTREECDRCVKAILDLNAALDTEGHAGLFDSAQDFVHHAAAVSRVFWPPGNPKRPAERARGRGEFFRSALAIPEDHVVQDRALRDHFEHFDERLDDWAERSTNRNIVTQLIGSRTAIGGPGISDEDIIHHYDPTTKIYAFRGEKFDLQALADGIYDLRSRISAKLNTIWPYKRAGTAR